MKNKAMLLCLLLALGKVSWSQFVGASRGEIYTCPIWYEHGYNSMHYSVIFLHSTNHGKSFECIYTFDYENPVIDSLAMPIQDLIVTNELGILYNLDMYYAGKTLVSQDFGYTWRAIDDYYPNCGKYYWIFVNNPNSIVKLEPDDPNNVAPEYYIIASHDYGIHFNDTVATLQTPIRAYGKAGWSYGEFFYQMGYDKVLHATDFYEGIDTIYLPPEYAIDLATISIGPREGELYAVRKPSGITRKIDYSDDYGHSFNTLVEIDSSDVAVSEWGLGGWSLWKDREPGVFYSVKRELLWEKPLLGDRLWITYFRDYGETLVTTYFHHLAPDWFDHHTPVMDCEIASYDQNSVTIRWDEPELKPDEILVGYQVFRNETIISEGLVTETEYTDNYLGGGRLNYHVLAVYSDGTTSRSYNIVYCEQSEGVDENEAENDVITISPNPTNGLVRIEGATVAEAQVYNTLGQLVKTVQNTNEMDMSALPEGVYLLRMTAKDGRQHVGKVRVSK